MTNENEFEYEGVLYVAVDPCFDDNDYLTCSGCDVPSYAACLKAVCKKEERQDNRDVVFKVKVNE